ncbi:MAG: RNA 2',3'-cyclic phosphodiesterase [Ignisphaera sp.]|uniref:RNA 2',3'-cyclic phosphodiesterase n=1 Tax=Ignisphaera aggregans TaxID=334771 RepID=A0A7J3MZL5_9CREN
MSIRCFIAIEIENDEVLREIIKVKEELSIRGLDIKPVEDENIHLTLRFLGGISQNSFEVVKEMLSSFSQTINRFEIEIRGLGAFPSIVNPRVIWVGIGKGVEELYQIRKIIDHEISKNKLYDIHKDEQEFHPHITLARVKSLRNIESFYDFYKHYNDYLFGVSSVTKIKLKQSILRPQGPIYRDVFIVSLR